MVIEVTQNKGVRGVWKKFKGEDARSRIELSVSNERKVDIEEEKRGLLLEVDFNTEIV